MRFFLHVLHFVETGLVSQFKSIHLRYGRSRVRSSVTINQKLINAGATCIVTPVAQLYTTFDVRRARFTTLDIPWFTNFTGPTLGCVPETPLGVPPGYDWQSAWNGPVHFGIPTGTDIKTDGCSLHIDRMLLKELSVVISSFIKQPPAHVALRWKHLD